MFLSKNKAFFRNRNFYFGLILSVFVLIIGPLLFFSCSSTQEKGQSRLEEVRAQEALQKEVGLGRLVAAKVIARYGLYKNEGVKKYVNLVGKGLAMYVGRPELEYHFAVLDSDTVNAFAAPGGYIFITKGLLKSLEDEAELAAVLAHEMAHVNQKHIIKTIRMPQQSRSFAERLAAIMGARDTLVSSAFSKVADQAQKLLFENGYKVKDEYEADEFGLKYSFMTGYDADGLIRFMIVLEKMEKKLGKDKAYHTHPPAAERLKRIRALKNQLAYDGGSRPVRRFVNMKKQLP